MRGSVVLTGTVAAPILFADTVNSGGTLSVNNTGGTVVNRLGNGKGLTLAGGVFNLIGGSDAAARKPSAPGDQFRPGGRCPDAGQRPGGHAHRGLDHPRRGRHGWSSAAAAWAARPARARPPSRSPPLLLSSARAARRDHQLRHPALRPGRHHGRRQRRLRLRHLRRRHRHPGPWPRSESATDSLTAGANVRLGAGGVQSTTGVSINSLVLNSGGGVSIAGTAALTVQSGGIQAFAGNAGISGGALTSANEMDVYSMAGGTLNLNTVIIASDGLTTGGAGTSPATAGRQRGHGHRQLRHGLPGQRVRQHPGLEGSTPWWSTAARSIWTATTRPRPWPAITTPSPARAARSPAARRRTFTSNSGIRRHLQRQHRRRAQLPQ